MRSLEFDVAAFEDLAWWVQNDRNKALRIIRLLVTPHRSGTSPRLSGKGRTDKNPRLPLSLLTHTIRRLTREADGKLPAFFYGDGEVRTSLIGSVFTPVTIGPAFADANLPFVTSTEALTLSVMPA